MPKLPHSKGKTPSYWNAFLNYTVLPRLSQGFSPFMHKNDLFCTESQGEKTEKAKGGQHPHPRSWIPPCRSTVFISFFFGFFVSFSFYIKKSSIFRVYWLLEP